LFSQGKRVPLTANKERKHNHLPPTQKKTPSPLLQEGREGGTLNSSQPKKERVGRKRNYKRRALTKKSNAAA